MGTCRFLEINLNLDCSLEIFIASGGRYFVVVTRIKISYFLVTW
jgi:hypothetical protein